MIERINPAITLDANRAAQIADNAWSAELHRQFGKRAGDIRYTAHGRGEPRSELHKLHAAFRAACDTWHGAIKGDRPSDSDIRANPSLRGKEAYAASLAIVPNYHDGTLRPAWEQLSDIARWSWERAPSC